MGIVNRYAKGLLHILDSQTQGDTPSSMGDVIAPTMDVTEHLLAAKVSTIDQTSAVFIALGQSIGPIVPAGEMWFLRNVGLEFISREVIATTWRFAIYLTTPTFQLPLADSGAGVAFGAIGMNSWVHEQFHRPIVMFPGYGLATTCGTATGAIVLGVNTNLTWCVDKMTI